MWELLAGNRTAVLPRHAWHEMNNMETSYLHENTVYPTNSLMKKLSYHSKKSTFTWRGSFDELKIFCFKHLEMDSTTCSITQNEQTKLIKAKSLTVNYYKTGTLQLRGNNAQSAKDKLRAAMDSGQTNCDLNDESGDVVSESEMSC